MRYADAVEDFFQDGRQVTLHLLSYFCLLACVCVAAVHTSETQTQAQENETVSISCVGACACVRVCVGLVHTCFFLRLRRTFEPGLRRNDRNAGFHRVAFSFSYTWTICNTHCRKEPFISQYSCTQNMKSIVHVTYVLSCCWLNHLNLKLLTNKILQNGTEQAIT